MQPGHSDNGGQSSTITIGLRDVYDQMQVITSGYTTLSAKLDTALIAQTLGQQSIAQQLADIRHDLNDHEMRLRTNEARPYVSPKSVWSGVAVLIAAMGLVVAVIEIFRS